MRKGFDNNWYATIFPKCVLFGLLWVIGIPVAFMSILRRNKDNLNNLKTLSNYGSLIIPYREKAYWFEIEIMIRKVLIVFCLDFLSILDAEYTQVYLALLVLFVDLLLQSRLKPYRTSSNNFLALM